MPRCDKYLLKHMEQLVGQTITGLIQDGEDPEFVGFETKTHVVFVLCDPEGNGPGFLDIQKKKEPK